MPKKVLIVDDDPHIVEYLTTVFADAGYATCSAPDGAAGFETLVREKPDLITLDLEMPEDAGPKFYRKMSKEPGFEETPVIVVSGLAKPHMSIKKAVAVVSKPFEPTELIALAQEHIGEPG